MDEMNQHLQIIEANGKNSIKIKQLNRQIEELVEEGGWFQNFKTYFLTH